MFFFKLVLKLFTHLQDRGHVDFVEGGQDGIARLRLQKTLCHAGTQAAHGHALLGALAQTDGGHRHLRQCAGRNTRRDHSGRELDTTGHGGQHIALGDAAIFAGARYGTGGQTVVGHQLGGSWHGHTSHAGRRSDSGDLRRCSGRCRSRGCRSGSANLAVGIDTGDQLFGGHRAAVGHQDLRQHAGGRGGHFQHHLVGFDLDQDFICGDDVTDFLFPLQHGGFGHGLRELRNFDFNNSHFYLSGINSE